MRYQRETVHTLGLVVPSTPAPATAPLTPPAAPVAATASLFACNGAYKTKENDMLEPANKADCMCYVVAMTTYSSNSGSLKLLWCY